MLPNRVLTTGAAGFIGSALAKRLLALGCGSPRHIAYTAWEQRPAHYLAPRDLSEDLDTAQHIVKQVKPDVIYHLAGMVTGANGIDNVIPTFHSLVTSTVNLLTVASKVGCERIIIVGSSNEPIGQNPNSPLLGS